MHPGWLDFLTAQGASFDRGTIASFGEASTELAAAREHAVVCDLSPLGMLEVTGADAGTFLQGQLTSDVAALAPGAAQYSAWCSAKGRVLANFLIRRGVDASYQLILAAGLSEAIAARLRTFVLRSQVKISDVGSATVRLGVGGPGGSDAVRASLGEPPAIARTTTIGDALVVALPGPRYVVVVPPAAAPACWQHLREHATPAGFAAWRWLTIRAGVPVITPVTSDQFVPQALNWDALGGINFQKGCYAGQEIVARTQYLGRLKERLFLAHLEVDPPEAGWRLYSSAFGEQACGTVVDAAAAPDGGSDALAVLQVAAADSGDLHLE
ncbi:MAG TPA: folate-binding protein, partial [Casimicrobiaceae bacterium]|nr:folate-binding protein [Casimicrobiaceae bacterium]